MERHDATEVVLLGHGGEQGERLLRRAASAGHQDALSLVDDEHHSLLLAQQPGEVGTVPSGSVTVAAGPVAIGERLAVLVVPGPGCPPISAPVPPLRCLVADVAARQDRVQLIVSIRFLDRVRAGHEVQLRRVDCAVATFSLGALLGGELIGHRVGPFEFRARPFAEPGSRAERGVLDRRYARTRAFGQTRGSGSGQGWVDPARHIPRISSSTTPRRPLSSRLCDTSTTGRSTTTV